MRKVIAKTFIGIILFSSHIAAQKLWQKPFTQWNRQDAVKILSNSPWAEARELTEEQISLNKQLEMRPGGQYPEGALVRLPPVIVRLHSALPIRQALIRLNEIEAERYIADKTRQAKLIEQNKKLLDCEPCKDNYVIMLLQPKNNFNTPPFIELFRTVKLKDIQGRVFLTNEKGEKRDLSGFFAPRLDDDPVIFLFPRHDTNKKLLFNSDNKKVIFHIGEFNRQFRDDRLSQLRNYKFTFDVAKMTVNDKVEF